jgi:hypothetical protein
MSDITRQSYWKEVRYLREACQEEWDGEKDWNEHAGDWLHETIDGHQWVIYTHYNFQVLQHSDNADAWEELGPMDTADPMWKARMAYCALERDVSDGLEEPARAG